MGTAKEIGTERKLKRNGMEEREWKRTERIWKGNGKEWEPERKRTERERCVNERITVG